VNSKKWGLRFSMPDNVTDDVIFGKAFYEKIRHEFRLQNHARKCAWWLR
jgi:hypothetical protein